MQYRELLHDGGRGIFMSRRRVKMQPTSEIIAICMLTSVIIDNRDSIWIGNAYTQCIA